MTDTPSPSRRAVLAATGGAFAAGLVVDRATSSPEGHVEVNVGVADEGGADAVRAAAGDVVRELDAIGVVTVEVPRQATTALAERPDVAFVEENGRMYVQAQTLPWGVDRTDADVARAAGHTGAGADVAVLDTGIDDDDHPDAELGVGTSRAFATCGASDTCNCDTAGNANACNFAWSDDNDHGTHVAGTVGAADDSDGVVGVAPGATLHAAKVVECDGGGSFADVAAGLQWTADQGYDVANMSIASGTASATVDRAIAYAASNGVTMVAAAGNSGPCSDCIGYPARHPEVMAVGASNCDDNLASFSSQGPQVDIIAPGATVYSTVPSGYATFSGTSIACSHVAGAAGVLAAQGLNRTQIISRLTSTAEDLGFAPDEQGAGLLDVAAAVGEPSTNDGFGNGPNC